MRGREREAKCALACTGKIKKAVQKCKSDRLLYFMKRFRDVVLACFISQILKHAIKNNRNA